MSIAAELHDDIEILLITEIPIILDDIWMIEETLYLEFTNELYQKVILDDTLIVHIFEGMIIPVYIYLARNTLLNLPSPSRLIILKFSLQSYPLLYGKFNFSGDFVWFRKNEGRVSRCGVL